jgi:hypothetical protein
MTWLGLFPPRDLSRRCVVLLIALLLFALLLFALLSLSMVTSVQAKESQPAAEGLAMKYGTAIHYYTDLPKPHGQTVTKSVMVRLQQNAAILFDTETLRYAGAWTGGYVNMGTTNITRLVQGKGASEIVGTMLFGTPMGPGFAGVNQTWQDPRAAGLGNLPSSWGTYHGLYRHGEQALPERGVAAWR